MRFGVVGMGVMGNRHATMLTAGRHRNIALGAVSDSIEAAARKASEQYGVPAFTDAQEMFKSGLIDAAVVATPHYLHPVYAIRAARAGLHVLCEKPLAVTVGPARAMIEECRRNRVALGAVLQMRTQRVMRKMRQIVAGGGLGEVYRVSMICSNWYRTQAYYDSGAWRGTWDGEGGGILLNQAPHSLDLFQWFGGMPRRIMAFLDTRVHHIEVENVAQAICQYEGHKTGHIYLTSAEVPGENQIAVVGDRGSLVYQDGRLRLGKLSRPISRHIFECKTAGCDDIIPPRCTWQDVPVPRGRDGDHGTILSAFAGHILNGSEMVASGREAINSLEIANAVILSGHTAQAVDIPVDSGQMESLLTHLAEAHGGGDPEGMRLAAARELTEMLDE